MMIISQTMFLLLLAAPVAIVLYKWWLKRLAHIPTVGPSLPVISYLGAYRFIYEAKDMLQQGYQKYKGGVVKIAKADRWLVVITGRELVDEVRLMPAEEMSFHEAVDDLLPLRLCFGPGIRDDPFHIELIRSQLTRQISAVFEDVHSEIVASFEDCVPASSEEWLPVLSIAALQQIVARVSNRVFVGLPMCRDEEYIRLAVHHTKEISRVRQLTHWLPQSIKSIVTHYMIDCKRGLKEGLRLLEPTIQARLDKMVRHGDGWSEKPNDMLQWILEKVVERGKGIDHIIPYVLFANFVAIHTSSLSFTHALYHLAANPEYLEALRREIETILKIDGWSKTAMQKMKRLDSFMRESQRVNGISAFSITRLALKDVTFSDGTFIPAGTMLVAPSSATHSDAEYYAEPNVFDPWRFSDKRECDGENARHQYVTTSTEYIPFGHGKHACPGRFFAANELKAMLAHTVMNYDVKFENDGLRPENVWYANRVLPNPNVKVLFRKRRVQ